jgi:hypothetical protein
LFKIQFHLFGKTIFSFTFDSTRNKNTMTKIFTLFILTLFLQFGAWAQDNIVINYNGGATDLSSGMGPYSMGTSSSTVIDIPFDVYNNAGITQKWRITRLQLDVPAGWADGLCWGHSTDPFGGMCYSSTQLTTNPWTTPGGAAVLFDLLPGEHGKMKADINPADGVYGTAHYRYYITSASGTNFLDSVDVIVDYVADIKPIKDILTVTLVPNPASDYINISASGTESLQFKMVDALGNVILRDQVNSSKKINTSELRSGVYFLTFESPTTRPFTRKVIIRH